MKNNIGLYGLGVMGQSLVINMANHGYRVSAYNKFDYEKVTAPFAARTEGKTISTYKKLIDFVQSLEKPRKIILMVTAGKAVDSILEDLVPMLEQGDLVADCGNSYYKDTIRREAALRKKGIYYFGIGVSGGEKGALEGPSIMPGGDKKAYDDLLSDILTAISAKTKDGSPCCNYIGPDGAGHYVKMVHNGIEYGDIEIICEAYSIMKNLLSMNNEEMADKFENWNRGRLNSYLIDITSKILRKKDPESGMYVVDLILDEAGQKGTGKWTSMEALDMGIAAPTIAESVFARCISAIKPQRIKASQIFSKPAHISENKEQLLKDLEQAVYASKILSYAQGFALLKEASEDHHWDLRFGDIALLWREGCIIRAKFLERIKQAFDKEKSLENLLVSDEFSSDIENAVPGWRRVVSETILTGIYAPAITNSLLYFDGYTSDRLPANLLQAQRDWFGAHTYRRVDRPHEQSFHTIWE